MNKLKGVLRLAFPQYLGIFSKVTALTSLALLEKYPSPVDFLSAKKSSIINIIRKTGRFGETYAEKKYQVIIEAAKAAGVFGYSVPSNSMSFVKSGISLYLNRRNSFLHTSVLTLLLYNRVISPAQM